MLSVVEGLIIVCFGCFEGVMVIEVGTVRNGGTVFVKWMDSRPEYGIGRRGPDR